MCPNSKIILHKMHLKIRLSSNMMTIFFLRIKSIGKIQKQIKTQLISMKFFENIYSETNKNKAKKLFLRKDYNVLF